AKPIPLYPYHFPALSGLPWHFALIKRVLGACGTGMVGLKDSSGDMAYAREAAALSPQFDVFPSTEAVLMQARSGAFAGCISATANLNADVCARAWRSGDAGALETAVRIRKLFDGKPLVPGVKALLAHIHGDAAWAQVKPPLAALAPSEQATVAAGSGTRREGSRPRRPGEGGRSRAPPSRWKATGRAPCLTAPFTGRQPLTLHGAAVISAGVAARCSPPPVFRPSAA